MKVMSVLFTAHSKTSRVEYPFLKIRRRLIFAIIVCTCSSSLAQDTTRSLVMVHFMPWFQTKAVHGYWGWHWTMNHYNPESIDQAGHRSIASHYYPLTGPYDSEDKNILEYQSLLMKIAGIDGALVDWYGMDNYFDYGVLHESTKALFAALQQAHLLFGIVYEDQTVKHIVENGYISSANALKYGKTVMKYAHDNWYTKPTYVKLDNHPVVLTFGPQYFMQSSDWDTLFSGLSVSPLFFTLDNRLAPIAAGAYPWPPMWKSNALGILTQDLLNSYLDQFYQQAANWPYLITSAFPGFYDIYKEAGVGSSFGYLDRLNGETFTSTLQQALKHHPNIIQIVTWNDYGEGTIVEPTAEFGYQYLETLQTMRDSSDATFQFQKEDLQLPFRIYTMRLQFSGNAGVNSALDRVFNLIITSKRTLAVQLMDSLSTATTIRIMSGEVPTEYHLHQNFPNPFNGQTSVEFSLPQSDFVTLTIYDMTGREIARLVAEQLSAGTRKVTWNADNVASGMYWCRMQAGAFSATEKIVLVR